MYAVREKENMMILFINPIAVDKTLKPKDIYADFDPETMEIGWTDLTDVPDYFKLDKKGRIVELTLKEQVQEGIVTLLSAQKIVGDQIVEKTLEEQLEEGMIELQPNEKIVRNRIVEKTLSEQQKEDLIQLLPDQKIEGNQIVEKTLEEQLKEGLIQIQPNEKIENNQIVHKTLEVQLKEGLIQIQPHEKIENNQIVEKSFKEQMKEGLFSLNKPFEYIQDDKVAIRSVEEAVSKKLITTVAQCEEALRMQNEEIEKKITAGYRPAYEMKLIKEYMLWIEEGKPRDDIRQRRYKEMQAFVDGVKKKYKPTRNRIKQIMSKLQDVSN